MSPTPTYLRGTVVRFGDCLKDEWKHAKAQAAKAKRDAAVIARIDALKAEILVLDCKPFGMRIGAERAALSAELSTLEAA
jgi:predicted glycosyltransferase